VKVLQLPGPDWGQAGLPGRSQKAADPVPHHQHPEVSAVRLHHPEAAQLDS